MELVSRFVLSAASISGSLMFTTCAQAGPTTCPADCVPVDGDGQVDIDDLMGVIGAWGTSDPQFDIVADGDVGVDDLFLVILSWGACPPPRGACCLSGPNDCTVLTEAECFFVSGTYVGDYTLCGPLGACCLDDGSCREMYESCCDVQGGFFQGAGTTCAGALCATADLDVDTDRDADIDEDDDPDEHLWTKPRGAFFMVNCNDSDTNDHEDAIRFDHNENPADEDTDIDGVGDEVDITPFIVRATGDLTGRKVYLESPLVQIQTVHVFKKIEDGEVSIWGGPTEANNRIEITPHVSETEDREFGLEGLKFRFIQAGHAMNFAGLLDLKLVIENAATGVVVASDAVRLKVAPYLMLPNTQDSENIYVQDAGAVNAAFRTGLSMAGPGQLVEYTTDTQWAQDPLEIGYTEIPTSIMWVSAHTRHQGDLAGGDVQWARDHLLGSALGLYRNPRTPGSDSGDFGGNIELLPATTTHKLGRICIGNTISDRKREFLESQEVQAPFVVDTEWLGVGHVDEAVGFIEVAPHRVVLASPKRAYQLLGAPFGGPLEGSPGDIPADDEVFFANGQTLGNIVTEGLSGANNEVILVPGMDFTGGPWQFIRVYDNVDDPEHPSIGQMAHITKLGNGFIMIDSVLEWFDIVPTTGSSEVNCAGGDCSLGYNPQTRTLSPGLLGSVWFVDPPQFSKIVLIEDSEFWGFGGDLAGGFIPAPGFPRPRTPVTVREVRINAKLRNLNLKVQERIDDIKADITAAAGGDPVTFLEVPVIYTASSNLTPAGNIVPRSCSAWNPGLANVVVAGGKLFFPKQRGPKNGLGQDRFEKDVMTTVGGMQVFVDDWEYYHRQMGEVHCGSNVRREPYSFKWWENQP